MFNDFFFNVGLERNMNVGGGHNPNWIVNIKKLKTKDVLQRILAISELF